MGITARTIVSDGIESYDTGSDIGRRILAAVGAEKPAVVLAYATVIHDLQAWLRGMRSALGEDVPLLGCSTQGIVGREFYVEGGYGAGAMVLAGESMRASTARQDDIHIDSRQKGAALGRTLLAGLGQRPKVVLPFYDPLCGANMDLLFEGLFDEVRCPIIGAAASNHYACPVGTLQFYGDSVFHSGAVAVALCGEWRMLTEICHGASPLGVELTVTKVDGAQLLEVDGRPALDVWEEITSGMVTAHRHHVHLAVGMPNADSEGDPYLVRAVYGTDPVSRAVILGSSVPAGARIMLHHRTTEGVLQSAARMAKRLQARLAGATARAILGFECGARTKPFLGAKLTREENAELQRAVPEGAWLGMLPWGEVYATTGAPVFHNYAYPLVVLGD